jgi:hypothetical protein
MTHVKRLKPRRRSSKLRKLLSQITPAAPRFLRPEIKQPKKIIPTYGRKKPLPYGYERRNHAMLSRFQRRKFLTPGGHVRSTLRQALASQGIYQASRLDSKWNDIEQRCQQSDLPEPQRSEFKQEFALWYKQGCPETRENYFWRIKYCGLIELGLEYRHYRDIRQLHLQRQKRQLKSALDHD